MAAEGLNGVHISKGAESSPSMGLTPQKTVNRSLPPPGTWVWVPDPDQVWRKAKVLGVTADNTSAIQLCYDGDSTDTIVFPADTVTYLCNEDFLSKNDVTSVDDLTQLPHLHEPAVLHALNTRFVEDHIYTLTGPILIAVNPFKPIPALYDFSTMQGYLDSTAHDVPTELPPHVFSIAAFAYRSLCSSKRSQTILISGESGAGKTESTKFVMKLLTLAGSEDWSRRSQVENQVLQSNPLLESIGNAKTLRNHNSSRFGKFIEMQFQLLPKPGQEMLTGRLVGASIHTYLLETVRVCQQMEGERNYHIFYQLCAAAASVAQSSDHLYRFPYLVSDPDAVACTFDLSHFKPFDQFRYLTKSSCSQLERINDLEEFEYTVLAMQTIGIPLKDQISLFDIVGAVLNLGNLLFEPCAEDSEASTVCDVSEVTLRDITRFLSLPDTAILKKALTYRTIVAAGDTYTKPLLVREAEDSRDALARALYGTLFRKLVQETNQSIGYCPEVDLFCGVLDIFGFECFQLNSFEQLCINYTNERLQQFFNTFVFKCEEQLYTREGVGWSALDFPDNQDCVDLLEQKTIGVFSMVDEECVVPRGNDRSLVHKLKDKHKVNKRFGIINVKPDWFVIHHFAGPVPYCIEGFVEKNKDQLSQDLQHVIRASDNPFVVSLFTDFLTRGHDDQGRGITARKRAVTVSSEFRQQLDQLMQSVGATDPHFIRCIKPNGMNVPSMFDRVAVTEQLRYGGVLQAVQVSRAGYPVRLSHRDALLDYLCLAGAGSFRDQLQTTLRESEAQNAKLKDAAQQLFDHLHSQLNLPKPAYCPKGWAVGETLVFFKQDVYAVLAEKRTLLRSVMATTIRRYWRGTLQRRYYLHLKACALLIQTLYRRHLAQKYLHTLRRERAAQRLQRSLRGYLARRRFKQLRDAVCRLQAVWRARHCRVVRRARLQDAMATRIQAAWRRYRKQRYFRQLRRATLLAQSRWRVIAAKRQLRQLRQQQREMSTLVAVQAKLTEENMALKKQIDAITAAFNQLKHEKNALEERLLEAEATVTSGSVSPGKKDVPDHTPDDATRVPSIVATSPSSVGMSDDTSRSPFHRVSPTVPASPSLEQSPAAPDIPPPGERPVRCRMEPVHFVSTVAGTTERLHHALEKQRHCLAQIQEKYAGRHGTEFSNNKCAGITDSSPSETIVQDVPRPHHAQPPTRGLTFDVFVLGHQGAGVAGILNRVTTASSDASPQSRMQSLHLLQRTPLSESTSLNVYSAQLDDRTWFIGHLEVNAPLSAQTSSNNPHDGPLSDILRWINESRYTLVAYSAKDAASSRTAEWWARLITSRQLSADTRFWRTCPSTSTDSLLKCVIELRSKIIENTEFFTVLRSLPDRDAHQNQSKRASPPRVAEIGGMSLPAQRVPAAGASSPFHSPAPETPFAQGLGLYARVTGLQELSTASLSQVLRPSVFDSKKHQPVHPHKANTGNLRPIVELFTEHQSPVSCALFSPQSYGVVAPYYLLAAGCFDGSLHMYRIFLTGEEAQIDAEPLLALPSQSSVASVNPTTTADSSKSYLNCIQDSQLFELHWKSVSAHTQRITAMAFLETTPVIGTSSADGYVRLWGIHTGALLQSFPNSYPCTTFSTVPLYSSRFLVALANGILCMKETSDGTTVNSFRFSSCITCICFDATGHFCFGGTQSGALLIFSLSGTKGELTLLLKKPLGKGPLVFVHYVPSRAQFPPRVVFNTEDGGLVVYDFTSRDLHTGVGSLRTLLTLRHHFVLDSSLSRGVRRSCYSSAGLGWFATPGTNGDIVIHSAGTSCRCVLPYHKSPVNCVVTNRISTALVSGDQSGTLVLWRWVPDVPPLT